MLLALSYPNITLQSSDASITVYLPTTIAASHLVAPIPKNDSTSTSTSTTTTTTTTSTTTSTEAFYQSTRFEHGSMIGSIQIGTHTLYDKDLWRVPHDPTWPESGVGLASEFGCGDDGFLCPSSASASSTEYNIVNGVLGYNEANTGEPFLKIGVGQLLKGSCPECHSTNEYKFNSPYQFAKPPVWKVVEYTPGKELLMEHQETLHGFGYHLQKSIRMQGSSLLTVKSTLTNTGIQGFATPWYSHHFFTSDGMRVGPGYSVDLNICTIANPPFVEEAVDSWSTPIRKYATVTQEEANIQVRLTKKIEDSVRIKAEFLYDADAVATDGSFVLHAPCGISLSESIPEVQQKEEEGLAMYAYNLYMEGGTLSPEPLLLLQLQPGESKSWTQRIEFLSLLDLDLEVPGEVEDMEEMLGEQMPSFRLEADGVLIVCSSFVGAVLGVFVVHKRRRWSYVRVA